VREHERFGAAVRMARQRRKASRVREMKAQGMRKVRIAKALKIGRVSVSRVLRAASR
jgi:DNA invertase Pin-like site-specific DNA recombinase